MGVARPQAAAYDMGAYEVVQTNSTYYVAGDVGSDSNDGSQGSPWKTIQKAATTMLAGDTVNVKGGIIYSEAVTLTYSGTPINYISFQSWPGTGIPTVTKSGGKGFSSVYTTSYISISGFIITGCTDGINIVGNEKIYNNFIYNNSGNGVVVPSSSIIEKNVFFGNGTPGSGQFKMAINLGAGGPSTVKDNIIANTNGVGLGSNSSVNGTFDYNLYYNNVGWPDAPSCGTNYMVCNGISAGAHDVSSNPLFVNSTSGNFKLQKSSPAIDAGTTLSDVVTDVLGVSLPQGSAFDIGAYEYYDIPVTLTSAPPSYINSGTLSMSGIATTISGGVVSSVSYSVDGGGWSTNGVTGLVSLATSPFTITTPSLPDGTHTIRIRATDSYGNTTDSSLYASVTSTTDSIVRNVGAGTGTNITCSSTTPTGKAPWIYQAVGSGKNSVILKFTNWQTPVDHFTLVYGTKSNQYQYAVDNIGGNGTNTYTVNSLNPNTTYYFRVRTGNGCAVGAWSNEISKKTGYKGTTSTTNTNSFTNTISNVKTKVTNLINQIFPSPKPTPGNSEPVQTQAPITQPQNIFTRFVNFFKGIFGG